MMWVERSKVKLSISSTYLHNKRCTNLPKFWTRILPTYLTSYPSKLPMHLRFKKHKKSKNHCHQHSRINGNINNIQESTPTFK